MGLSNSSGGNFTYLKTLIGEDYDQPTFAVMDKNSDGKWRASDQTYNQVEGILKEVSHDSYTYEGNTIGTYSFVIEDEEGSYKIDMNSNSMSRSVINSLAGVPLGAVGNSVLFRLYRNNKGYDTCYVEVNGQRANWKFEMGQFPTAEKVQVGNKTVVDDSAATEFFNNLIDNEIMKSSPAPEPATQVAEDDDDMPF